MKERVSRKKKKQKKIILSGNSVIKFMPLTRVPEPNGKYYIGREDTSTYLHLTSKHAEIIRLCNGKRNLRQVIELYTSYHGIYSKRKYKELLEETLVLIEQLQGYGFIQSINSFKLQVSSRIKKEKYKSKSPILKVVFSIQAMVVYFIILAIGIALIINNPSRYFPRSQDVFWNPSISVSLLTLFAISLVMLFKHELAHLLSALEFGIKGKIYLSRRMFYLVAETNIKDIYKLPLKKRLIIYLSGIASDGVVFGICMILVHLASMEVLGFSSLFILFIKQITYVSWISILWQFRFFMKTDIYAIFEDISGCDELLDLAKAKIMYWFYKLLKSLSFHFKMKYLKYKEFCRNEIFIEAKHILSWYTIFVFAGILISIIQFIFYDIPITITVLGEGFSKIIEGIQFSSSASFFDGIILLFLQLIYWGLFVYILLKELSVVNRRKWDEDVFREIEE